MKGDLHPAAFRLACSLGVRTHERRIVEIVQGSQANNGRPVPVIVDGVLYESMTEAARRCGIGREAIRKRIYKGTARYA